jgi:4,5-dihydroxyphthalate decarboxylase
MPALSITAAMAHYGHVRPLLDGTIQSERVTLEPIEVSPITAAFRRMVRRLEFDISEMAFATYLCARAHGKAMTALPIFLTRRLEHGSIVYNTKSGIQLPADLAGRRVGVRSYTLTPGIWVRGILQSAYGVALERVTWVLTGDEHVAEYVAPANVVSAPEGSDLKAMLLAGEIDAAIGLQGAEEPELQPLIANPQQAGIDYYRQTGIYPISHMIVMKDTLLEAHPWLAETLCDLFLRAKSHYLSQLNGSAGAHPINTAMLAMRPVLGDDHIPYDLTSNRRSIEALIRFCVDQHIIPQAVEIEDIFPNSVLNSGALQE